MPAKVNIKFSSDKNIRKIQTDYSKKLPRILKRSILSEISKGISPVRSGTKKGRWDKPYSPSYIKAIREGRIGHGKATTPINLKVTGKLWRSLNVVQRLNSVRATFKSKIADFHNRRGAGASGAIRRMLPDRKGENFNRTIEIKMDLLLRKVVKDNL